MAVDSSPAATGAPVSTGPNRNGLTSAYHRPLSAMNCIGYLSYGTGRHQYEVAHSASTARRYARPMAEPANAFCIKVITDTPLFFQRLEIDAVEVDAATIDDWRGPMNYGVRGKIKAMQMLFAGAVKVILVDGDTYFIDDPSKLFRRSSPGQFAHVRAGMPARGCPNSGLPSHRRKAESSAVCDSNGARLKCGRRTMQWNSGVVGLVRVDAHLLTDVLTVIIRCYPDSKYGRLSRPRSASCCSNERGSPRLPLDLSLQCPPRAPGVWQAAARDHRRRAAGCR